MNEMSCHQNPVEVVFHRRMFGKILNVFNQGCLFVVIVEERSMENALKAFEFASSFRTFIFYFEIK